MDLEFDTIVETDDGERCTWEEWRIANVDTLTAGDLRVVVVALETHGEYTEDAGGSASWSLRVVQP